MKFINKYFGSLEWLIISVVLIILPLIYTTSLIDAVLRSRLLALSILLVVISTLFTIRFYRNEFSLSFSKSDKIVFGSLGLFLLVNIVSGLNHVINPKEAIVQVFKETSLAFIFLYFHQLLRNRPQGKNVIVKAMLIMTFLFTVIGFIQLAQADFTQFKKAESYFGYYLRQAIINVKSTLASQNPFASFLYLSLAFSSYGIINFKKFWRAFSIIITASSLFFIGLLASKASWGALAIFGLSSSILIYYFILVIKPKITGKLLSLRIQVTLLLIPFLVITGGFYLAEKTDIQIVKVAIDKVQQVLQPELCLHDIYNSDNPTSTQTRTLVWGNTLQMTKDNPLLGVGPGQWRIEYANYGLDGFEDLIRNGSKHFQRTHNDFFWIMGETGFTGIAIFIFIYIFILITAFRSYKNNSDTKTKLTQGIFFSILLGFILILSVSFPRERITHNITYLLLFAFILFFSNQNYSNKTLSNKKTLLLLSAISTILLSINLYITIDLYRSEQSAKKIQVNLPRKNFRTIKREALKVHGSFFTMDNFAVPMPYYLGIAESNLNKDFKKTKKHFNEAFKIHPYHLQTLNNLATSYDLSGDKESAIKIYNEALRISPRYKEAIINKSIVLFNLNKIDEAYDLIKQIPPNEKNPDKYRQTLITIIRKKTTLIANKLEYNKIESWYKDDNKIFNSFVKIRKGNINLENYLLKEFGK